MTEPSALSRKPIAALRLLFALSLSAAACGEGAPRVVGDIPQRLADTTFWRMFETMSEPGGYFRSDNFVSNEAALQYVIPDVKRRVGTGGVYLGVGPEQNFTYLVAYRPRIAFIVDIRRQNAMAHLMYKALIELAEDRADFVSRLFSRPRPEGLDTLSRAATITDAYAAELPDTLLFRQSFNAVSEHLRVRHGFPLSVDDLASIEYVMRAFFLSGPGLTYSAGRGGRPGQRGYSGGMFGMPTFSWLMSEEDGRGEARSFLANEANFRILQDIQRRNLVVPVVGDFAGNKALRAVGDYVASHGANVSVFYTSNVEQYLFQEDKWRRFYINISHLPTDDRSTLIRSVTSRYSPQMKHPNARMAQLTMTISSLLDAVKEKKINTYYDVIEMSK